MTDEELDRMLAELGTRDVGSDLAAGLLARARAVLVARTEEVRSPWRRAWRAGWDVAEPWAAAAAVVAMLGWALGTVAPVLGG